jgi:hypothetical protein
MVSVSGWYCAGLRSFLASMFVVWLAANVHAVDPPRVLEDFSETSAWRAAPSDGVELKFATDEGRKATARPIRFSTMMIKTSGIASPMN